MVRLNIKTTHQSLRIDGSPDFNSPDRGVGRDSHKSPLRQHHVGYGLEARRITVQTPERDLSPDSESPRQERTLSVGSLSPGLSKHQSRFVVKTKSHFDRVDSRRVGEDDYKGIVTASPDRFVLNLRKQIIHISSRPSLIF